VLCEGTAEEPLTLRGSTHLHLHELLPAVAAAWAFGLAPALLAAGIDTFDVHTCAETH
jgi:cyanophycin synthetase